MQKSLNIHNEIKESCVCVTRRAIRAIRGPDLRTTTLCDRSKRMCHLFNVEQGWREGGGNTSNVSKSGKTVTSLQRTAKVNLQSHTHKPQERRKMGPVYKAPRSAFSPARETKVEKYVLLCSHGAACFPTCCILLCACTCADSCNPGMTTCKINSGKKRVFIRMNVWTTFFCCLYSMSPCEQSRICFLHFPFPFPAPVLCKVCPLGQHLWTSAMRRPLSGSSGVCLKKIPTWTQQTLRLHVNTDSGYEAADLTCSLKYFGGAIASWNFHAKWTWSVRGGANDLGRPQKLFPWV